MAYLESAPLNYVYLMCHINIEKSQLYRVSQGFYMTFKVTLRKKLPMDDLKMVEIHQVDYIDDISKGFVDGGDRSIQSLLRHSVTIV